MGLDLVEFGMGVEEEFGVRIPDSRFESIRTVGDVRDVALVGATTTRWPSSGGLLQSSSVFPSE